MISSRGKISMRQLAVIFLLATYSPIVRLSPSLTAKFAKRAAWISPVFSSLVMIVTVIVIQSAFKKGGCKNLSEVFEKSLGKIIGRGLNVIYLLWLTILLSLYVRYYAARMIASILPGAYISILSVLILVVVFIAVRVGLESFARLSEIFFIVFVFIFIGLFGLMFASINLSNLYPVTHYDIVPALKGIYPSLGIWGYFTFAFFLGDFVTDKENAKYIGLQSTAFLCIREVFVLIVTIGAFGYSVMERATLPFFVSIKSISILNTIERIEALLVTSWVVSDFVIIVFFIFMIQALIKHIFGLSNTKYISTPIILFAYVFSLYFALRIFELREFSATIGLTTNIITCFIIPYAVIGIGKLRKTI